MSYPMARREINNMFFFCRSKKVKERIKRSDEIDEKIAEIQANKQQKADELTRELEKLTKLVKEKGVTGIWEGATPRRKK